MQVTQQIDSRTPRRRIYSSRTQNTLIRSTTPTDQAISYDFKKSNGSQKYTGHKSIASLFGQDRFS